MGILRHYMPEEADFLGKSSAKGKMNACSDRVECERLNREINDRSLKFNLLQAEITGEA